MLLAPSNPIALFSISRLLIPFSVSYFREVRKPTPWGYKYIDFNIVYVFGIRVAVLQCSKPD